MIEPNLTGAERTARRKMLLGGNKPAVGAPACLIEQTEIFLAHLAFVRAVGIHNPDIIAAATVRRESDAPAIGREARLGFKRKAIGNARRRAATHWHRVDIAKQIERQCPAIRADIQVHP
jgi:hypothetical protein